MKTGKVIQQEDIQDILELTKISNISEAPTAGSNLNKWRNSLKYQIDYQLFPELCKTIENFINDGTKVNQFDLLLYKEGHYYKKHKDVFWINNSGRHRKLSAVIQLSDPNDYEGGDLTFFECNQYPNKEDIREQGTVTFFPAFIDHQANPVLKGTRYSIAIWFEGPKWR